MKLRSRDQRNTAAAAASAATNTCSLRLTSVDASTLAWQASLFGGDEPAADAAFSSVERRTLAGGAWVDFAPGWLAGADRLFATLLDELAWEGHRRWMYDRMVDDPRLTARGLVGTTGAAGPSWVHMADLLDDRYGVEFTGVSANLYRDGRDSVAWHGDRVARDLPEATVALVSLGGRRPFLLRPEGRRSRRSATTSPPATCW